MMSSRFDFKNLEPLLFTVQWTVRIWKPWLWVEFVTFHKGWVVLILWFWLFCGFCALISVGVIWFCDFGGLLGLYCDLIFAGFGYVVVVVIWFWLSFDSGGGCCNLILARFGRGGGCDLILDGFRLSWWLFGFNFGWVLAIVHGWRWWVWKAPAMEV